MAFGSRLMFTYAYRVVRRAVIFFALWTVPPFILAGAYAGDPIVGGVAALIVYFIAYRLRPYGKCVRCDGAGRFFDVTKAYWSNCPRCGGGGRAYRAGLRP